MAGKLKKGDISLKEVYLLSKKVFKSGEVDDKKKRARLDITSAKVSNMKNFIYDKNEGIWKSTAKRSVKFEFIVRSKPISYKKTDHISTHIYPVTIVMFDIEQGMDSSFRYRSGSFKKPIFAPKGCSSEKRIKIEEQNIHNGTDLWFFFSLERVLFDFSLLHGPCHANRLPRITNPKLTPYFEKHSLYCIEKALIPILQNPMAMSKIKKMTFKNEERPEYKK